MRRCPICKKTIAGQAAFCSDRCRQIDLGKWMNEEYRVPVAEEDAEEDGGRGHEA